jgi:cholesterol transport system auxiliary component
MIKQSTLFFFSSCLLLFLTLMGCTSLNKNYPERNYYIFNVSIQQRNLSPVSGTVLDVPRFDISPSFAGTEFVYRIGDLSYQSDFYNQFLRPPASLITEGARKWLSESGLFKYVVNSSYGRPNYVLEGNVNELYGDFRAHDTPKAVLGIQFFLIDEAPANPKIIFQNNYRREVALSSKSPGELVKGWNEALQQILTALDEDLRKVSFGGGK